MQGPEADLALLIDAAHGAGEIALSHFRQEPEAWFKDGNKSPVTEADIAIDRALHADLRAARPDYGWLSEETEDDGARLSTERAFLVDPIDGTRAFIDGSASFAHSLAIAENGEVIAGVVYLPVRKLLFAAAKGQGATLNGEKMQIGGPTESARVELLASSRTMEARHWPGGLPDMRRSRRASLAYQLAIVGQGRFDAMVSFWSLWEWDIAAGALIAAEAGACVTDAAGLALRFNRRTPRSNGLIVANPALHADLLARHRGRPGRPAA
ncbi:MAG: 3'(2'),5'-bisphosphate nucleotidase CysQ [Pseudomonadota bacterium]